MTQHEAEAYNAGVRDTLALARMMADRLAPRLVDKPTRVNFAMEGLDALAEDGRALLMPVERRAGACCL